MFIIRISGISKWAELLISIILIIYIDLVIFISLIRMVVQRWGPWSIPRRRLLETKTRTSRVCQVDARLGFPRSTKRCKVSAKHCQVSSKHLPSTPRIPRLGCYVVLVLVSSRRRLGIDHAPEGRKPATVCLRGGLFWGSICLALPVAPEPCRGVCRRGATEGARTLPRGVARRNMAFGRRRLLQNPPGHGNSSQKGLSTAIPF